MGADLMRLPVTTDLRTRLGNSTKDSRLVNATVEKKSDGMNVRKRPGMISTGYNFTSTQVLGFLLDKLALIHDDILEIGTPVVIGTLVDGYYAMIDNPPTLPGPGDDYWSVTDPGPYRVKSAMSVLPVYYVNMADSALSPWIQGQLQGPIAASVAASYKKLLEDVTSAGGVLVWGYFSTPPNGDVVTRFIPLDIDTVGDATDFYSANAAVTWTAGYDTSDVGPATTLAGFPTGPVATCKSKSSASVTITSTGTVAQIAFSEFGPSYRVLKIYLIRYISVSGSPYPEYNGNFQFNLSTDPLATYADAFSDLNIYYTMTGTPAAATTTATVEYYF